MTKSTIGAIHSTILVVINENEKAFVPSAVAALIDNFGRAQCGGCAVVDGSVPGVVNGANQPSNLRSGLASMNDTLQCRQSQAA